MPGSILNADTGFPTFAEGEDSNAKIDKVMNYLYMLLEQLRYSLANLDADNFNETGLREIGEGIARPLQTSFENEFGKTNALIEGWSNEYGSQIKLLTEWKGTASQSISSLTQKADANHASIEALTKLVDADSKALAGFKTEVSNTYATTQQFSSFQTTVNNTITNSYAGFVTQADAKYAKTEQIASVTDEDGNVTAASIAAEIKDDTSLIKLIADKVEVQGVTYFESLGGNYGVTTVDGDDIGLISDPNGDSISRICFYKWKYDNGKYNTTDNMLSAMFRIQTVDNGTDAEDYSRLSVMFQTFEALKDNAYYNVAMKFISDGSMSFETDRQVYLTAGRYCTLDAKYNTRIRATSTYNNARNESNGMSKTDYSFNTDGIYYGSTPILTTSGGATAVFG